MLKLIRNNWANLNIILDHEGNYINYEFITKLYTLQEKEFLRFATKIRKSHIDWERQKMKVKLAAQTLSSSVADAIEFLAQDIELDEFTNSAATVNFLKIVDRLFDLCNSRNIFQKGYKGPLKVNNEHFWRPILLETVEYLMWKK